MKVLIVGGSTFHQLIIAGFAEASYHFEKIWSTDRAEEAVNIYKKEMPNAALIHTALPGINFIELLKALKRIYPETKVILCGAIPSATSAVSALNSGACYYLLEPFSSKSLMGAMDRIMKKNTPKIVPTDMEVNLPVDGLQKVFEMIESNYAQDISLEEAARLANMSPSYFCTQFKLKKGMSFKEYLTYVRISKAKYFLSHTNQKVKVIAELVGFNNSNYFTNVLQKMTNFAPSEYRTMFSQTQNPEP